MSKENFRNVIAAQEGSLYGNARSREKSELCKRCKKAKEISQHIVSGCEFFRATIMLERHNSVCQTLYFALCKRFGLPMVHHTQCIPGVSENGKIKVLYDLNIVTKTKLKHNKPDIVVFNKSYGQSTVIEVSVSWYGCLNTMEKAKYHKYVVNSIESDFALTDGVAGPNLKKKLSVLYCKEYKRGVKLVPIVIRCCGEITHNLVANLENAKISSAKGALKTIERIQRGVVVHTGHLVKSHLCCPA